MTTSKLDLFKEHILERRVRVLISDDRGIEGVLTCLDKDMNLIIEGSTEYHNVTSEQCELS